MAKNRVSCTSLIGGRLLHDFHDDGPAKNGGQTYLGAGWSSPVARQAHNLKVVGSNPTPATKLRRQVKGLAALPFLRLSFNLCLEAPWKQEGA